MPHVSQIAPRPLLAQPEQSADHKREVEREKQEDD